VGNDKSRRAEPLVLSRSASSGRWPSSSHNLSSIFWGWRRATKRDSTVRLNEQTGQSQQLGAEPYDRKEDDRSCGPSTVGI